MQGFHEYDCSKPASVHVDGRDWCGTHNPLKVKARRAVAEAGDEIGWRLQAAKGRVRALEREALAGIRASGSVDGYTELLLAADKALAEIEAEARAHGKVPSFYWGR
jgi:hypothetical protein